MRWPLRVLADGDVVPPRWCFAIYLGVNDGAFACCCQS